MLDMQQDKTIKINNSMSEKALGERETIKELLKMFGVVQGGGGFTIIPERSDDGAEEIDDDSEDV